MKATWVPDLLTPLSFEEAASAMRVALNRVLGQDPRIEVLALALAKCALETGRWKSCHRHNWGNVKCSESYDGLYTTFRCNEVIKGKVVWFDPTTDGYTEPPGHPQTRFRAFRTASDGALAYVQFVAGGRYAKAWQLLLAGDAAGFVHALKQAGYFTADEAAYLKGVASLQREFVAKLQALPHDEPSEVDAKAIVATLNAEDRARLLTAQQSLLDDLVDFNPSDLRAHEEERNT